MPAKKDNDDTKAMLLRIRRDCTEDYPWSESDPVIDSRYCMALGLIAGIITEAIQSVQQDRKANFKPFIAP